MEVKLSIPVVEFKLNEGNVVSLVYENVNVSPSESVEFNDKFKLMLSLSLLTNVVWSNPVQFGAVLFRIVILNVL